MARHRDHPIAFKRQVVQEYLTGEISLNGIAKQHEICRHLLRVWVEKYERGEYDEEMEASGMIPSYEARIAALKRMVGRLAFENEFLKKASQASRPARDGRCYVITGPLPSPSPKDAA